MTHSTASAGGPATDLATDLADCTATELLALYRSGQASPTEATQAVRSEEHTSELQSR